MKHPLRQRGLSMIELMIGVAIGLVIAVAGSTLLVGHLRENRALLLEARLTQDLRTAANVITRDLRRAGYWGHAGAGANPYAELSIAGAAAVSAVSLSYSMDATENDALDGNEQFGFRLRNGAIELQLGADNWQSLTDAGVFTVTRFSVTPEVQDELLASFCASTCAAGSTQCPPHRQVRSFAVVIDATLVSDPRVRRSAHSNVRIRSDAVVGGCTL